MKPRTRPPPSSLTIGFANLEGASPVSSAAHHLPTFPSPSSHSRLHHLYNGCVCSGHVSLGVRTLLELHSYITESFPDQLRECVFCHELVVLVRTFLDPCR
jgi:hypothetical protein